MLYAVSYAVRYAVTFKKVPKGPEGSRRFKKVQEGSRRFKKVTNKYFFVKIEVCGKNLKFSNISENNKRKSP